MYFKGCQLGPRRSGKHKISLSTGHCFKSIDRKRGLNTQETSVLLGVNQPQISELAKGKIQLFSIDKLINMLAHAGMHIGAIEIRGSVAIGGNLMEWLLHLKQQSINSNTLFFSVFHMLNE
jgi:hypothetical protein